MRLLNLYVETSVFGFVVDQTEFNRAKRESTEKLFQQFAEGKLMGYVSVAVLGELLYIAS